ncbi:CPBP family intramembrane glutamic endopeptidase [Clostridium butanoliproducens]|uniref:CPBP family intramembrane glutamic endopeptidase n=1 Tax=Clostridium butanoliproducens TaxID=2991837 RepID=UPI0024B8A440|nr:CPBP family intramembrane glutamic endopeptidase [Clostridium butanoliproducens]MDU1348031.1 CPBP family intramembrane glutamic endopeptidase [Clostridium argentinense]
MKYLLKTHNYLKNLSTFKFIIAILILKRVSLLFFSPITYILFSFAKNPNAGPPIYSSFTMFNIIDTCILGPFFETLIFQSLVIFILQKIKGLKNNNIIIILISSILFGVAHYYNVAYIFKAFIAGILYAYSYLVYKDKDQHPIWVVTIIHALHNSIVTLLMYFNI